MSGDIESHVMCLSCWVNTITTNLIFYIKAHLLLWGDHEIPACYLIIMCT